MEKKLIVVLSSLAVFAAVPMSMADEHKGHSEEKAAASKTGRKKRQIMCKDCGKPEKNCECKGEEHGEHAADEAKKQ